jgi:hypothetical protein
MAFREPGRLNPGSVQLPDCSVNFVPLKKGFVVVYVAERFHSTTAHIVTDNIEIGEIGL